MRQFSDVKRASGFVRDARQAGSIVASATPASTMNSARTNEIASVALTPKSTLRMAPLATSATNEPARAPIAPSTRPRARNASTTDHVVAPSAMRIPISCVRCFTVYDTSP